MSRIKILDTLDDVAHEASAFQRLIIAECAVELTPAMIDTYKSYARCVRFHVDHLDAQLNELEKI